MVMRGMIVTALLLVSLWATISAKWSTRGLGQTRTSALKASVLEVRGGASRKKKVGASTRRVEEESDSDEEEVEERVEKGYVPKEKGLAVTLVTLVFRLLFAVLSPLLPEGLAKKLQGKKAEVAVAGRMSTAGSAVQGSRDKTTTTKKKSGAAGKLSSMTQEHLEKSFTKGDASNRVQKELRAFLANPPDNCKLTVGANIRVWIVQITGAEGTIFAGEKYKLKMVFPKEYPTKPPSVYFLKPTPRHVHVYSNGDICLNLLGKDWRPTMSAQLLVISIYSMLSSAKEKKIPQDNAMHADNPPGQQQEGWMYHDDRC